MLLRQVQARPLQGHHLRALRRRGDAAEGAPRAHGPHRPRGSGLAHLVLQGRAEPDRLPARHRAARAREGALLRGLDRHPGRPREAPVRPRRPRGQGRRRDRAHLPRPRRGAVRARRPAGQAARLLRRRQGAELRRGRRLLGPRPEQLGRGGRDAAARGDPDARQRCLHRPREEDHERGSAPRARARPPDGDARRPPARAARGRVRRRCRDADRGGARAASGRSREGDRVEEGRDHEAPEARPGGPALRSRADSRRTPRSSSPSTGRTSSARARSATACSPTSSLPSIRTPTPPRLASSRTTSASWRARARTTSTRSASGR